jgi:hypothetical protein
MSMGEPVGVAVLRIWRVEDGSIRVRLSMTIDVAQPALTEVMYCATSADVLPAIVAWMERFAQTPEHPGGPVSRHR